MKPAKTLLIILSIALTGCGGGDSSPIYAPPTMEIKGQAVDGLILNADVSIYSVHADGSTNTLLGTAKTSLYDGSWKMPGIVDQEQKVYIEVCDGYYIEEATGNSINLNEDECLSSYDNIYDSIQGEPQKRNYTVSGITHMAAAYTKNQLKNNASLSLAMDKGKSALATVTSIDPHETIFKDITSDDYKGHDYESDDNIKSFTYSIISAGVSALVNDINLALDDDKYRSIDLWQRFYQDLLHDGLINGEGKNGTLKIGSKTLDGNLFRTEVMRAARKFVTQNPRAKIKITDEGLKTLDDRLNGIAANDHTIYNGQEFESIDDQPPITQWDRSYVGGAFIASTYNLSFVEDNAITRIVVTLVEANNEEHRTNFEGEDLKQHLKADNTLAVKLTPRKYATGDAVLSVLVRDDRNNEALTTTRLTFVNKGPAIMLDEQTSAISSKTVTLSGTYTLPTSHTQMAYIKVFYMENRALKEVPTTFTRNVWLAEVEPKIGGEIVFTITACDTIGNCYDTDQKVLVDNKPPKIEEDEEASYKYDVFEYNRYTTTLSILSFKNGVETWPPEADHITRLHYPYGKHRMGNVNRDIEDLKKANIPYIAFKFFDPDDNGSYHTPSKELSIVEEYYTARLHSNQFTFYGENKEIDTNLNLISTKTIAPTLAYKNDKDDYRIYVLPLTTETLGEDFVLTHPDTTHIIRYTICDEAGNCTWTAYSFAAMFASPTASDINLTQPSTNTIIDSRFSNPHQKRGLLMNQQLDLFVANLNNTDRRDLWIRPQSSTALIEFNFEIDHRQIEVSNRWRKYTQEAYCIRNSTSWLGYRDKEYTSDYLTQHNAPQSIPSSSTISCYVYSYVENGCYSSGRGENDGFSYDCWRANGKKTAAKTITGYEHTTKVITASTHTTIVPAQFFDIAVSNNPFPTLDGYYRIPPQQPTIITGRVLTGYIDDKKLYSDQEVFSENPPVGTWRHDVATRISYTPKLNLDVILGDGGDLPPQKAKPINITSSGTPKNYTQSHQPSNTP